MKSFIAYQRVILAISVALTAATAGLLFTLYPSEPRFALGVLLGAAGGLLKLRLDVIALLRFAQNAEDARGPLRNSFRTYAIMAGVLLAAVTWSQTFYPLAAFAGLMLPRLVLIADGVLRPAEMADETPSAATGGDAS